MKNSMKKLLCAFALIISTTMAWGQNPTLPDVENLQIEGDLLTWDALNEATGYNISLNRRYYDTVRDVTSYRVIESGIYRITPFNDNGEYGSDYGLSVEYLSDTVDTSVHYSFDFSTLIVYKTCTDVGPGESCVARCPTSYTPESFPTIYPRYMSGGACSTSDIVEADAWVGHRSYHCTVPTFSGEVIAQAICIPR